MKEKSPVVILWELAHKEHSKLKISVFIATGAHPRKLNFKGEKELRLCQGGRATKAFPVSHCTPLPCRGKMRRLPVATFIL